VDPAADDVTVLVWRRRFDGDELLEVTDTGRTWRLPRRSEIGLRCAVVDGPIGALVHAPHDFDPGRLHRWVRIDAGDPLIGDAWRQAGAAVVVWRRGASGLEVLLLHQSVRGPDYDGDWAWSSPGGSLDPGETLEECAARELWEETGLDLPVERVARGGLPIALFTCEARAEHEIVLSDEHDRFEWVSFDDALARCRPEKIVVTLEAARRYVS
jgi:8-oxo-dGTP pyrophosphatase MutT (NUDIX family)